MPSPAPPLPHLLPALPPPPLQQKSVDGYLTFNDQCDTNISHYLPLQKVTDKLFELISRWELPKFLGDSFHLITEAFKYLYNEALIS